MAETGARHTAADADVRARALQPGESFIVQAPAGSGKTELLIQRLLVLLARVEEPEQVLAITFTRKAAAEMRARLVDALDAAAGEAGTSAEPASLPAHELAARERARAVLSQDAARGWGLRDAPGRLRIQTIDSLCSALTRAHPLRSGLGEIPGIAENPTALYREAARATLAGLEAENATAAPMRRLLLHLDGNHARVEALLCAMLAKRDQWLRHIGDGGGPEGAAAGAALRQALEAELHAAIAEALAAMRGALIAEAERQDLPLEPELSSLVGHAVPLALALDPESSLGALAGLRGLPEPHPDALPAWQGLAELLTTSSGTWRRSLTKNQGFPTDRGSGDPSALRAAKDRAQALLAALEGAPHLAKQLRDAAELPSPHYSDAQWAILEALLTLLPEAVRHLRGAFAGAGETDYTEVALAAVRALEAKTDHESAAVASDDTRHILVDEFQDTSHGQFRLLEGLTAHWPQDGSHTLFLVGDPMQSIYRFREAEVGLFLRAQQHGIGGVALKPLTLSVNFRSTAPLVDWVNSVFPQVLAAQDDVTTGAVRFTSAVAHIGATGNDPAVHIHPLLEHAAQGRTQARAQEAEQVAGLVAEARRADPDGTVAVLVRTRGHLQAVLPALRQAGLGYQAVEIEGLAERPEVQDLLMLTRALTHLGDRVAWLALLRAPWCGLTLADLLHLVGDSPRATVWERLCDDRITGGLADDARQRAERVREALTPALARRERAFLRRAVEGAWLALGAPATLSAAARTNAEAYLSQLERLPAQEPVRDAAQFAALLEQLYAAPDPAADVRLQVMSMHRAKGLQFDTVILPGLHRVPRSDDAPLLRWRERPDSTDDPRRAGLLLAPIHEAGPERDAVYDFLARIESERERHEAGRLLYVAATRARRALHLLGSAVLKDGDLKKPDARSLLARLWPAVETAYRAAADTLDTATPAEDANALPQAGTMPSLHRLPATWQFPTVPTGVPLPPAAEASDADLESREPIEFRWAGETARHVGTVVHRLLRRMAAQAGGATPPMPTASASISEAAIDSALGDLGVSGAERPGAVTRVRNALERTLADERGRWVLAPHTEARSEYALTTVEDGRVAHSILDRTFVADGVRWIVDFKTSTHEGGDLETFLQREQKRYNAQLNGYARLMRRLDPGRPVRLALYFPLLQAWREWAPEDES